MLLRHTTKEIQERKALVVNPAKTCQPIGAMYAALGIHRCLPHSHGSQGCCSYHRSTLTRHYREPIMAATSSFTEGTSVFGGQANLIESINNIFTIYDPDIIAVHTTCLSETIGDDVPQIIAKAHADGKIPANKMVIHANTPSYVGSHVTGFANMVKNMVTYFSKSTGAKLAQLNVIPGWIEPADMREIKRLAAIMGINTVLFPDTSNVLDAPQSGRHQFYPKGGVTINQLKTTGDSEATISLGEYTSLPAATALDAKCKVPFYNLDIPIGLTATDRFVQTLHEVTGVAVPDEITDERGRMVDIITDMQQYFHGKRVALFGDPDQLISLTEFLVTLDMRPVYVITGTPGKRFEQRMKDILAESVPEAKYQQAADMFLLHQWIKQEPVDLLIGNTYGKYIARDEDIPFIRFGFPILDRIGHSYLPSVGYAGGIRLLEKLLDALLDRVDTVSSEETFELVM